MNIGKRLRELRLAKGLSQADIQERTGLQWVYISRMENGHILPKVQTLKKVVRALDVELYQVFYAGDNSPKAPETRPKDPVRLLSPEGQKLIRAFAKLEKEDQELLLRLTRQMAAARRRT